MNIPVEAEVKYQISEMQYRQLPVRLLGFGFIHSKVITHEDHYIEYSRSPWGGFDFVRVRKVIDTQGRMAYLWNKKTHAHDAAGSKIRLEEPRTLDEQEFMVFTHQAVANHPTIIKNRQEFTGNIQELPATVCVDSILIGGDQKYFVEIEIMTDPEHGAAATRACKLFAKESLNIQREEADGYLHQYLSARQI